ncbi:MAG: FAD-binding oxidoreductase, partial [Myxococcales bacterium]|nr:FAD-binding oxidoreductase [Myxococcales bacterium]
MSVDLPPSSTDPLDTFSVSRDCWPGGTLEMWRGGARAPRPSRVFWPEDEAGLLAVLQEASSRSIPVVPYGMGSGVCGGARGREGSWVVDTKRLRGLRPVDEDAWTVRVQAGVNGQELEDRLNEQGFTLGHSPSSISCSSVGGWAAARSAGQFSSRYGVFEDMVLGLTAVTPSGVLRLGTHGDDDPAWMPMLLGSEGTLGVVTELTLRVWRAPETRWLRGYRFRTVEDALDAVRRLMQSELWPSVVRIYDPVDTGIGGKTRPKSAHPKREGFLRSWLKRVEKLDPVRRRTLALPLTLPGFVNTVFDAMASGCLLVVGWEGREEVVDAAVPAGRAILEERGEDLGSAPGHRWFESRHAVSYKLMPVFERGGFADTMEVSARWSSLPGVYRAVREAVRPFAVVLAHMSHVYPEGGSIYFSFAGKGDQRTYTALWEAAQSAALAAGASISHHHGVGSLKTRWASQEVGAAVEGWRAARDRLDPVGIMNPGRLFVPTPPSDAGPDPRLHEDDGLMRCALDETLEARAERAGHVGGELMFPWETLPAPPR